MSTSSGQAREVAREPWAEAQRPIPTGSWNWDILRQTVTWSDELYRIFGVAPQDIDPVRDAMGFIHPDDRDGVLRVVQASLESREPYSLVYRIRRRDGRERIVQSQGYLVDNDRGELIYVFGTTQDLTERKEAEEAVRRSEQLLRLVLDAIPVGVAVLDPAGNVVINNPASTRIWAHLIPTSHDRYARSKAWWHDTGRRIKPHEWASARALAHGETSINEVIEIEGFDGVRKVIHNSAVPIRDEREAIIGAVVINEDVSAQKAAERDLESSVAEMQSLATRLMVAQDDERRRIARMLHEMTAQDLAALKMLLARLGRSSTPLTDADRALLNESMDIAERSMSGVRTLSYLLHPPFLDENGLLAAVRWYSEGFASRSGISIELDLPAALERQAKDIEMALFRVVQEALINIHRHAQSPTASIRLRVKDGRLTLEVHDRGAGIPPALVTQLMTGKGVVSVGVAGMSERLKQLGGTLEIESSGEGTIVRALLPFRPLTHDSVAHSDRR
jgi:PAS domain S-box-containing protein